MTGRRQRCDKSYPTRASPPTGEQGRKHGKHQRPYKRSSSHRAPLLPSFTRKFANFRAKEGSERGEFFFRVKEANFRVVSRHDTLGKQVLHVHGTNFRRAWVFCTSLSGKLSCQISRIAFHPFRWCWNCGSLHSHNQAPNGSHFGIPVD